MAKTQAKGSASRILLDFEDSPGATRAIADRLPVIIPFNSVDLQGQRNLNRSETIQGDRNATEPFQGNLDVSGNLVVPIDDRVFGYFAKLGLGKLESTKDTPNAEQDKLVGSGVTLAISSGTGTFSAAQNEAAVGDRVIYEKDNVRYTAYLTGETSDTVWTVSVERDAATAASDITGASVVHIIRNSAATTPGDITIASNVVTFDTAQPLVAVGALLIYSGTKKARIVTVNSTSEVVVEGVGGADITNEVSAVDVEAIELDAKFKHRFVVDPVLSVSTSTIEVGYQDLEVPYFERFTACKIDSIEVPLGGDGELTATLNILGGEAKQGFQPYDKPDHLTGASTTCNVTGTALVMSAAQTTAVVGDKVVYIDGSDEEQIAEIATKTDDLNFVLSAAVVDGTAMAVKAIYPKADSESIAMKRFGSRFQQFDATTDFNGSAIKLFRETSLTMSNNLDGDQYLIGGGGTREEIPEGTFNVSGSLQALFKSQLVIDKAKTFTTISLKFVLTRSTTGRMITFEFPEVKLQEKSPAISGPQGVLYDPTFEGFKKSGVSAAIIELIGDELGY